MDLNELKKCINQIEKDTLDKLKNIILSKKQIIILGNGGSNSISSHISQDYTKVLKIKSFSFSDPSRLTCYINDYGQDQAYVKFIEHFYQQETLVILISSSGNSMNIVNSAEYCKNNNIDFITLSGFDFTNKLKSYDDFTLINFWVDSHDYGIVELTHEIILHSIL
jgi:D-sedoheptulose 7-phosphate isomerase